MTEISRAAQVARLGGDVVSVKDFGAVGDGVTDDTAAIQDAVDSGSAKIVALDSYVITSSIIVPLGVSLEFGGRDSKIYPKSGGSFISNFIFLFNTSDGVNPTSLYPNLVCGGISNVTFDNEAEKLLVKGCIAVGSYEFLNIRGRYMHGMIERMAGHYSDNFKVSRIYCEPVRGSDYQINLRGLGDSPVIEECHFPYNGLNPSGVANAYYIGNALAGRISDCVGGNVKVDGGSEVTVSDCHLEKCQILVNSSSVKVVDTFLGKENIIPIVATSTSGLFNFKLSLDNVQFAFLEKGTYTGTTVDVELGSRFALSVRNCYRKHTVSGGLDKSQLTGISIGKTGGTLLTDFNNYSYQLSNDGEVCPNYGVPLTFTYESPSLSYDGIIAASTDSASIWAETSGTYFYKSQLLIDESKALGRNQTQSEKSVALTNASNGVRLDISYGSRLNKGIVRVYRGTSSGAYTAYADLHVISLSRIYDNGDEVNGTPWVPMASGSPITLNADGLVSIKYAGDNVEMQATTSPTVGTHTSGDRTYRTSPASAGYIGSVYNGSAWLDFGLIV
jgi:hypothetical protein